MIRSCLLTMASIVAGGLAAVAGDLGTKKQDAVAALKKELPTNYVLAEEKFLNPENWEGLVSDYWTIKDDTIVGESKEGLKFNTFLCSKKKYKDFDLSFKARLKNGNGNSGVQIRSEIANPKTFAVKGPQADIGAGYWGSLYGELFGGMMKQAPADKVNKSLKKDDFNDYSIKVVGKKVTIKVNDVVTVDEEFEKLPADGIIAFQLHAGGPMQVTFKDIKFTELK